MAFVEKKTNVRRKDKSEMMHKTVLSDHSRRDEGSRLGVYKDDY